MGASFILLPALGSGSLERAEIYFMDGARSMVERGDWLVPYYRGQPFFDKPALTYWLIAASFRLFGFTPGAARLVLAVAALLLVVATVWLGCRLFGERAALTGGFILATTFAFMTFGRWAMSDMLLALFSTLAFGLFLRLYGPEVPGWPIVLAGAALGLGFLTKGPVALLLPGLGILWLALRRGLPQVRAKHTGLFALLFALFGLSWFVAVFLRLGPSPLEHFFFHENMERFAGDAYDSGRSPFFYLGTYMAEGAPWSFFMPIALFRLLSPKGDRGEGSAEARELLAWIGLMLVPLSLSRGKIDYYILPLYPPASLVLGRYFASFSWRRLDLAWASFAAALGALLAAASPLILFRVPQPWAGGPSRIAFDLLAALAALAMTSAAFSPSPRRIRLSLGLASGGLFAAAVTLLVPKFVSAQPNAAIVASIEDERAYRPDVEVARCSDPTRAERDILFYTRIPVLLKCDLWSPAWSPRPFLLILDADEREALRRIDDFRMVYGQDYLPPTVLSLERLFAPLVPEPLYLAANYPSRDPRLLERERRMDERRDRILKELQDRGQAP